MTIITGKKRPLSLDVEKDAARRNNPSLPPSASGVYGRKGGKVPGHKVLAMSNDTRLLIHLTFAIAIFGMDGYVLAPWLWDLATGTDESASVAAWIMRPMAVAGTMWVVIHLVLDRHWQPVRTGSGGLLLSIADMLHGREERETLRDVFGEIVLLLMLIALLLGVGGHMLT